MKKRCREKVSETHTDTQIPTFAHTEIPYKHKTGKDNIHAKHLYGFVKSPDSIMRKTKNKTPNQIKPNQNFKNTT